MPIAEPLAAPRPDPVRETVGWLRGVAALPTLLLPGGRPGRGDGGRVLVLPGFGTGDLSTVALRGYLGRLGHDVSGWGLGRNTGNVDHFATALVRRVRSEADAAGGTVSLVGWSLGGVIAREVAHRVPGQVRHVVTIGSPVVGGPKYTAAAPSYVEQGYDLDEIEQRVAERLRTPMPVPVTAIYSRADSIVAWQACLDPNPDSPVRHVEVGGSHAQLGFSPEVLRIVATALAGAAAGRGA